MQQCPSCGATSINASFCSACGKSLVTGSPPTSAASAAASTGAVGRFLRCPACFKTVTGSGDVCPFCGAALGATTATSVPVTLPKYDIVGGCLLVVMLFLLFVVYLLWLLE